MCKTDALSIRTERLELLPLDSRQLALWTDDLPQLEAELACSYQAEPMQGTFLEIVRGQALRTAADPSHWPFSSFWWIIRRADRVVIGSEDFKAPPEAAGSVEIGYGLASAFEHQGYMTEAAGALCDWAFTREDIRCILAETEKDNLPSQNVLKRLGFSLEKSDRTFWWRLERKKAA